LVLNQGAAACPLISGLFAKALISKNQMSGKKASERVIYVGCFGAYLLSWGQFLLLEVINRGIHE
jgi:hypothetical protein